MIVKVIDLSNGLELVCYINPIKSEISIVDEKQNPDIILGVFPSIYTTYRIIKDNSKLKGLDSYVKGLLKIESVLTDEDILVRDIDLGGGYRFAVITEKSGIDKIKKDYPSMSVLDYEITSILRLLEFNNKKYSKLIHFNKDYATELNFDDGILKSFITKDKNDVDISDAVVSGFIPEGSTAEVLNNPTGEPRYNIAYGGALHFLSELNMNFLRKESSSENIIITTLILLLISFFILNGSYLGRKIHLDKKVNEIKALSTNEVKKIGINNVVDPLLQVKGVMAGIKDDENKNIFPFMDKIGFSLSKSKGINIFGLNITSDEVFIDADAQSMGDIEVFMKSLPSEYNFSIVETSKDPKGKIKFKIKGKR